MKSEINEMDKITKEMLKEWGACSNGYRRFVELFPDGADLKTASDGLSNDGHDDWAFWLFNRCKGNNLFVETTSKGYQNSGDQNSGYRNSGDQNSGDRNSGYQNSGDRNSGDWNSGDQNSGDRNSGDRNSGYRNSGDWNSGDRNSGYLNSVTPETIRVFNKECSIEKWDAAIKPDFLFFWLTYWVDESEMTDEEKAADPYFYVSGGQLRKKDYKQAFQESWENADKDNRELIRKLPNFDADVFFEISGIDLRDKK